VTAGAVLVVPLTILGWVVLLGELLGQGQADERGQGRIRTAMALVRPAVAGGPLAARSVAIGRRRLAGRRRKIALARDRILVRFEDVALDEARAFARHDDARLGAVRGGRVLEHDAEVLDALVDRVG